MAILVRPYWSPREISSIVSLLIHAIAFGPPTSAVVKETSNKIHERVDTLEKEYAHSTIYVLGDFNSTSLKLPRFKQQVTCTTRKD